MGGAGEGTSQFMEATLIDERSANKIVQISMLGVIDGQPLDPSGYSIVNHIEDYGFLRYEMGYAAAVSFTLFFILVALTLFQFWGARRWVHYE